MVKRCSALDQGAVFTHMLVAGGPGVDWVVSPRCAVACDRARKQAAAGRGTAWCLGQGLAQILSARRARLTRRSPQPHNCDSGQHQCSQTSTVCVLLFALSHYFKQAFKHKKVLQTDKHPKYLNIDVHKL